MEIELDLTPGPRQREFMIATNPALRQRTTATTASARADDGGRLESVMTGPFQVDE